ncbi:unnamed protein product, partial [marine sediment metagenome]
IRPIYNKMKAQGKDVLDLFNQSGKKLQPYSCIVTASAAECPSNKRQDAIYHFHSLGPGHAHPKEVDHRYLPAFKGVLLPGEWWVGKWVKEPNRWAVVGWPKNDLLVSKKTVLYAPTPGDHGRMKTLNLLITLSRKMSFSLIVKLHSGIETYTPERLQEMIDIVHMEDIRDDIAEYFDSADVLVSEASGALWEFMATGKPSVQMQSGKALCGIALGVVFPGGIQEASLDT